MAQPILISDIIAEIQSLKDDAGNPSALVADVLVFAEKLIAAHGNVALNNIPPADVIQLVTLLMGLFPGVSPIATVALGVFSTFANITAELKNGDAVVIGNAHSHDFKVGSFQPLDFDDTIDFFAIRRTSSSDVAKALGTAP